MERMMDLLQRTKEMIPRGIAMFSQNNMSIYSGYATLFIITAMIPFVILIISVVNLIPGYSADDVVDILLQILPDLEGIRTLVTTLITSFKDQSGGLLASAAAVTTLWAASKGVMAIQKGLNQLDESASDAGTDEQACETREEEIRSIASKALRYFRITLKRLSFTLILIILIPALLIFDMLGDSVAGAVCSAVQKLDPDVKDPVLSNIYSFFDISALLIILLAVLVILQFFAKLPAVNRTLKSQLPGAVATGACWVVFTELFAVFIKLFYHSSIYGVLAVVFLLLMWLRYMVMILFGGAVMNRLLEQDHVSTR